MPRPSLTWALRKMVSGTGKEAKEATDEIADIGKRHKSTS
jgi:hypothetical protein